MERQAKINLICLVLLVFLIMETFEVNAWLFRSSRRRNDPPPPPPPPCKIQSAGCYKTGDIKAGFGELAPSDFSYFLPENKCIKGGCTCGSVSADVAQETSPDSSSGACACIAGTEWNARGRCCGNDIEDCGRISTGVLCSIDANAENAQWIGSQSNTGDIRYVGCSQAEYLSLGESWKRCEGSFWRQTIGTSEYLCIGKGRESIIECCGDGSCKSRVDGKRLTTGQSINPSKHQNPALDPRTYYCTPDRKFVNDLDVAPSLESDTALITKLKSTCEKAGLKWTGTKCCSEDDDLNEYYNDEDGNGGCWNKKYIKSVDFVEGSEKSIISYKGVFHGCAVGSSKFNTQNNDLLGLADKHTGEELITDHEYCFNDPAKEIYCSFKEKWEYTQGADKTQFSLAPDGSGECCADSECWDGKTCVENQEDDPLSAPINGLRCIGGEWKNSSLKKSPDETATGYCPQNNQCLLSSNSGTRCINQGEYSSDNLCENGEWTTRTKILALQLLGIKRSNDFTIFCDTRENALNNLAYLSGSQETASTILSSIQTNNFCILNDNVGTIIATSINKNIQDISSSHLSVFGINSCQNIIDDDKFHPCDSSNKVWYNKKLKGIIYGKSAITVGEINFADSFVQFMKSPMEKITEAVKRLIEPPSKPITTINKFDKLFIRQQGSKLISGTMEGKFVKSIVIEYAGFDANICSLIDEYNKNPARKDASSAISCKSENGKYYVLAQGSAGNNLNPETIWPDLTAKLRIK